MKFADISVQTDPSVIEMGVIIREAIFPFRPGRMLAFVSEDRFEWYGRTIQVTVENLPNFPFRFEVDQKLLVAYPSNFKEMLYQTLFEFYRYRPATPVDDHIVLGEG